MRLPVDGVRSLAADPPMSLVSWIKKFLFPVAATATIEPPRARASTPRSSAPSGPAAPLPQREAPRGAASGALQPRVGALDSDEVVSVLLESPEEDLLWRLGERIEAGRLDIPLLPPTSVEALGIANRPSVDVPQLVEAISRDPLMTSELLRMANSALYATQNEAGSLQQAVMRVGLRTVRTVVFSAAMKGSLGNARRLSEYAEEVWRQAQSIAHVSRAMGGAAGFDREQAYLIGLLHDLGKIALLGMLQSEMKDLGRLTPALVGRTFRTFHELAGGVMAEKWKLPEEIVSIAGAHHHPTANETHPREAALAKLAHEVDLRMSLRDDVGLRAMVESPLLEALGVRDEGARWKLIETGRKAWERQSAADAEEAD